MKEFRSKGPELLVDMAHHVAGCLVELLEVDREKAEHAAQEIANRMAAHWGGQNIYFPMGLSYKLSQRDQNIYAEFTGDNHSDLARKYGISLQWLYKIVKAGRQEEMNRRQGSLL